MILSRFISMTYHKDEGYTTAKALSLEINFSTIDQGDMSGIISFWGFWVFGVGTRFYEIMMLSCSQSL